MQKVLILGCSGSGKSTFSQKLAQITGLPVVHLDSLYWRPGWNAVPNDEWEHIVHGLVEREEWILDGNYSRTLDIRLKKSDTVIYFDLPTWTCLYRILKRRVMYHGKTRVDMGEGCQEKLDLEFVQWVWKFRKKNRAKTLQKINDVKAGQNVYIFRSSKEAQAFLDTLDERTIR